MSKSLIKFYIILSIERQVLFNVTGGFLKLKKTYLKILMKFFYNF